MRSCRRKTAMGAHFSRRVPRRALGRNRIEEVKSEMKIRLGNQSLRIRISLREAEMLCNRETVSASLRLSPIDEFEFELSCWNLSIAEVHLEPKKLIASIPEGAAIQLMRERGFTFRQEQMADTDNPLKLEVEIDFEKAERS
jgi:hypothetical protein